MTVVLGCAGFVLRHPALPAPVRTDVEQIRQAAERTARITAQLLAFGRRQHLQTEIVDLDAVLDRLRAFLERALGDRSTLALEPGSQGQRVRADVGQLEQTLLNLTLNARDAMPLGGTLTVRTMPVTVAEGAPTPFDGRGGAAGRVLEPGRVRHRSGHDSRRRSSGRSSRSSPPRGRAKAPASASRWCTAS